MRVYHSDHRGRHFISLAAFLLTIVILLILNVLRLYVREKYPQYLPDMTIVKSLPEKVISALMIVLAAVYLVFIVIILPIWYKTFKYVINNGKITSYSGLFSRSYRIMRISSIQHASVLSMPMSKYTSFNFISLNALGGNMLMLFLSDKDCMEILKLVGNYCPDTDTAEAADDFDDDISVYTGKYNELAFDSDEAEYIYRSPGFSDDERLQVSFFDSESSQLSFYDKGAEDR